MRFMSRPSGPVRCDASVWNASSCRLLDPLGAMNGWRGGSGAKTGCDVQAEPMNSGSELGPSGMGFAAAAEPGAAGGGGGRGGGGGAPGAGRRAAGGGGRGAGRPAGATSLGRGGRSRGLVRFERGGASLCGGDLNRTVGRRNVSELA